MESVVYVGMDVDSEKIAIAVLQDYEGQPRVERVVPNRVEAIEETFAELLQGATVVQACYEASGCGFGLYRRLTEQGVCCMVVAPSSLARKPGDRVKTDRRDARKLALALRRGELSPIYIPSRREESVRDYLRLYEDVKVDLKKAKQRLIHFLYRHEIRYTDGSTWTGAFWKWLGTLEFRSALSEQTFEEYLTQVRQLDEKRVRIKERIEQIATEPEYEPRVKALASFKGIATLTALSMIVEIGDFRRFARAEQFMAFLGLVPSEHSSGGKRRIGSITKAGNSHLRKLLIEAAWHARSYQAHSTRMKRARQGVSAPMVAYADRAGRRLSKKYWRLLHANRPPQVAATAVARELAGFVWGAMVGKIS